MEFYFFLDVRGGERGGACGHGGDEQQPDGGGYGDGEDDDEQVGAYASTSSTVLRTSFKIASKSYVTTSRKK